MRKTPLSLRVSEGILDLQDVEFSAEAWLFDSEIRQHSRQTIAVRRIVLDNLLWLLRHRVLSTCSTAELRRFLAYVSRGREEAGGRRGSERHRKPVRPRTVRDYHHTLRAFFRWLVEEGYIEASPMESIRPRVARADQIQPFAQDQVAALLIAADEAGWD